MTEQGWTRVIALGELPERTSTRTAVEGVPVMLYRDGEQVFAIGTRCTHQGAPLDRGPVRIAGSEATVTCPAHGSVFRLEDGRVARGPATSPVPPAVDALAGMAAALGWRTVVVDDGGDATLHPSAARVLTALDLTEAEIGARSFVVVATQGHYDDDALQRALETPAAYVGLVASRRRADAVLGYLRDRGVAEGDLARVHAPAGLDLGRLPNQEIAVAILAELVQLRASGSVSERVATPADEARHEEIDPVCGMTVEVSSARYRAVHEGRTYYFCAARCLERFTTDPAAYLGTSAPS